MATNWTEEQKLAIYESGKNIIVSAGAGSGKTAVLSERVLQKVLNGIHVNELLVLTFTKAAAAEMKERIRKKIRENGNLKDELSLIDGAYITTFDSFALSVVKKYHDILNVTNAVKICDEALITIKTKELLDEIMDEYYAREDTDFLNLIKDFCLKDDKELKNCILNIFKTISLKYDPIECLENEIPTYFDDNKIEKNIKEFVNMLKININEINGILKSLSLAFDSDYMEKLYNVLNPLLEADTYEQIKERLEIKLPQVPRNTEEDIKALKNQIKTIIDSTKKMMIYENEVEIKEEILSTKNNTLVIAKILKELFLRLQDYKDKESLYDFNDIFHMAIKVVKEHEEVKEELKNSFKEILVDEYQDTSDLQEIFISMISNNNVYMVGDVKQSIYRFRNANPYIFKEKYDNYALGNGGMKIDLTKNFRSRKEVLSNINLIFDYIMSDDIGGADYKVSHRMNFGNMSYENEGHTEQVYDFKIKTYEKNKSISNTLQEAFIVGRDIKEKIESGFKIFNGGLRSAKYSDFSILLDKSKDFEQYKKVLDYLKIPCTILRNDELTTGDDILVLKNLFKLVLFINEKKFDEEFRYAFLSVGRSFLFDIDDEELFSYFVNKNFDESIIYEKCLTISNNLDEKTPNMILEEIIKVFDYEEKILTLVDVKQMRVRIEYIMNFLKDFSNLGQTLDDFVVYLDNVFDSSLKLSFSTKATDSNAVSIMTIHHSKGLEFPVCYFAGFTGQFNFMELNEKILYSNDYGLILPKVTDVFNPTIMKSLLKQTAKREEISERIRLLYVALTRAKEHMIIVCPEFEKEVEISTFVKMKYKSFYDILQSVSMYLYDYMEKVESKATNDFLYVKNDSSLEISKTEDFVVNELEIEKVLKQESRFSKNSLSLQTKEEKDNLHTGVLFHQILEMLDFKNPNLDLYNNQEKKWIISFLNQPLIKENIDEAKFYHEYEFLYNEENVNYHGIIDLMIEKRDTIIIIDYKLKNIDDSAYANQLNGYRKAIEEKTKKPVKTYLYSILNNELKEV